MFNQSLNFTLCAKPRCKNPTHTSDYCELHEQLINIDIQGDIADMFLDNDLIDTQEALEILNRGNVGIACNG